jgi:hypothetical protein
MSAIADSFFTGSWAADLRERAEDLDEVGILREPRLVLHPAGDHHEAARRAILRPGVAQPVSHQAGRDPDDLLVRMGMGRRLAAGFDRDKLQHHVLADHQAPRGRPVQLLDRQIGDGEQS